MRSTSTGASFIPGGAPPRPSCIDRRSRRCVLQERLQLIGYEIPDDVAGATLLYGTDGGVLPHDMGGWQFGIMVERGMTPMQAIQSATSVAADHMGLGDSVGALREGFDADIIAVPDNPLTNIDTLRRVPVVIKNGQLVKGLDENLE